MTKRTRSDNKSFIGWGGTKRIATLGVSRLIVFAFAIAGYPTANIQRADGAEAGMAAQAAATVTNGSLASIQITFAGSGYGAPPNVSFLGGGGSGASALAQVFQGALSAINIQNPGSGYTNAPIVVVDPPAPPVIQATLAISLIPRLVVR